MSIICLARGTSLIGIDAICLLVAEDHNKLLTIYWLPKLHEIPYKLRFVANSSSCTTTELSIFLTSCLNAITNHVIKKV